MQLQNLTTKFLGRHITHYNEIDSTQSEAWRRIEEGTIKSGELIMADIQTKGIGTHGRKWHTSKKNNIAFSFVIEAKCHIDKLDGITTEIAEILVDVFKRLYGVFLEIKFPNDVVYHNKKLGGILTQTKLKGEFVDYLVIGIRN